MRRALSRYQLDVGTGFSSSTAAWTNFSTVKWIDGPPGPYNSALEGNNTIVGGHYINPAFFSTHVWPVSGDLTATAVANPRGTNNIDTMPAKGWIKKIGVKLYPATADDTNWAPTELEIRLTSKHPLPQKYTFPLVTSSVSSGGELTEFVGLWRVAVEAYDLRTTANPTPNNHNVPDPYYGFYAYTGNEDTNLDYQSVLIQDDFYYHKTTDEDLKIYLQTDTAANSIAQVFLWIEEAPLR